MPLHQHIATCPNFVSPLVCQAIKESVVDSDFNEQGIMLIENGVPTGEIEVNHDSRFVYSGTKFKQPELIHCVSQTIVEYYLEPEFLCNVQGWEYPQLLKYTVGGHYKPHVDGEEFKDNEWKRVTNRHLTALLYLDDDYEGGNLTFPEYNIAMRPSIGQLVAFPSNRYFSHGVEPLISGERHVLVFWSTLFGESTVEPFKADDLHIVNHQYAAIKL